MCVCVCVHVYACTCVCVCRFIGELFKLKMLTEGIMHDCIRRLLRSRDEESLECLCRLLTTIGCDLDKDKSKVCTGNTKKVVPYSY